MFYIGEHVIVGNQTVTVVRNHPTIAGLIVIEDDCQRQSYVRDTQISAITL
jgi:hypothetical protein